MKKLLVLTAAGTLMIAGLVGVRALRHPEPTQPQTDIVLRDPPRMSVSSSLVAASSDAGATSARSSPGSMRIAVPFAPQAPFANWDALHEEACEEMSLIMVLHYWNREPLSLDDAEKEVGAMVDWETANGMSYDVTMEELAEVARGHGFEATVTDDVTAESIEGYLNDGYPIIIPAAGRDLGNPFFSGAGPWYHALVIVGYDNKNYIVNDPGTKRGENFVYKKDVLLAAIHDWTGVKEEIRNGEKRMLIIRKP